MAGAWADRDGEEDELVQVRDPVVGLVCLVYLSLCLLALCQVCFVSWCEESVARWSRNRGKPTQVWSGDGVQHVQPGIGMSVRPSGSHIEKRWFIFTFFNVLSYCQTRFQSPVSWMSSFSPSCQAALGLGTETWRRKQDQTGGTGEGLHKLIRSVAHP